MGYEISGAGAVVIPADRVGDALATVQAVFGDRRVAWLDDVSRYETLAELVEGMGFDVSTDEAGTFTVESYSGKAGDEDEVFGVLAPFVAAGGTFTWQGEEDCFWQWRFDGDTLSEVSGEVVFPDPAPAAAVEGPTFRFSQQCHLTYVTDAAGTVVGIELMPWQETPGIDDYQDDALADDGGALIEAVHAKAVAGCWELPGDFPEWVEWS